MENRRIAHRSLLFVARTAAGLSTILGLVVLIGWYTHNIKLIQVFPQFVPMQYNTAMGFLLCGIGALAFSFGRKRLATACGGTAGLIGFMTLLQYIFNVDLGIDQLLMKHYITVETSHPGRMAPNTALCFGITGAALLILNRVRRTRQDIMVVGILGSITAALGVVSFFGYLSGVETAYGWGNLTRMAVHTATGFFALGMGIFAFAWFEGMTKETWIPRWIAFPAGIGMATIALTEWQALSAKLGAEQSVLPIFVLVAGLLVAGLLTITIQFAQMSWRRAQDIESINWKLEDEIVGHKQAEKALRESEEKYRRLIENAGEAILVAQDGVFKFVNPKGEDLYGYSQEELASRPLTDFIHEEDREMVKVRHEKRLRGETLPSVYSFRIVHKDGHIKWVELSVVLFSWDEKPATLCFMANITEHKKAEEALQRAKEETDLANKAKSEFLANMSHEIRTPMNSVIGFTDMLMDSDLNEDQKDYAETIKGSGEALLSLINDILDFSKIEAGELDLEAVDFDPELLAYDVCKAIRPRVGSEPIEIICHIGDELPAYVKGDPGRFRQVLTNLMGNASKFTEAGEIEIALNVETERNDRVRLHAQVRDTGIGLPQDKLSTIFDPFHQADGSTTRKYGGTGLGLSICKQISKLMDGDIWAESEVNKGSIFHFTAWFEKVEKKETKRFIPLSLSGKKALIVDDNQRNLDILTHNLKSIGMDVVALKNGEEVIPTFQDVQKTGTPFDLCIIDIQMPIMSGYDVAREIRNWEKQSQKGEDSKRRIPLIALSSLMQRDAKECEEAGFDAFLSKPVHREKLYQMLERMVAGREFEAVSENAVREKIITQYTIREVMKHSVRILLAEDNPVNQKLATMMLTKAGYQVEVANNGREAVEKIAGSSDGFDLIFMDVQMPEMDGLEATKEIRRFEGRNQSSIDNHPRQSGIFASLRQSTVNNQPSSIPKVPIVAMTAHAMKGDMEMCLEAGMDDYITKPIKREVVFDIIEKWVFNKEKS